MAHREPDDEHGMEQNSYAPDEERRYVGEGGDVRGQLHQGHQEGGAHACKDGVVEILSNGRCVHEKTAEQKRKHQCGAYAAGYVCSHGKLLQQNTECGKAERNAAGGNGHFCQEFTHERLLCFGSFSIRGLKRFQVPVFCAIYGAPSIQ